DGPPRRVAGRGRGLRPRPLPGRQTAAGGARHGPRRDRRRRLRPSSDGRREDAGRPAPALSRPAPGGALRAAQPHRRPPLLLRALPPGLRRRRPRALRPDLPQQPAGARGAPGPRRPGRGADRRGSARRRVRRQRRAAAPGPGRGRGGERHGDDVLRLLRWHAVPADGGAAGRGLTFAGRVPDHARIGSSSTPTSAPTTDRRSGPRSIDNRTRCVPAGTWTPMRYVLAVSTGAGRPSIAASNRRLARCTTRSAPPGPAAVSISKLSGPRRRMRAPPPPVV